MSRIAFLGLGNMGHAMATNLVAAGRPLAVWNRTPGKLGNLQAAGAVAAATPAAAAKGADFVVTMLADDRALEDVSLGPDGLIAALAPGAIHISMSTVGVACSKALALRHAEASVGFLAAPVFGRPEAAREAKLWIVAGGPAALLERCRPLLERMGQGTIHVGEAPESANLVKLAGNFLIGAMIESLSEAFALLRRNNVDPALFQDLIARKVFRSPVYENYGNLALAELQGPPAFKLALALKDISLAVHAAEDLRVSMPVLSVVHGHLLSAVAQGMGDLDLSQLARLVAADAGLGHTSGR